MQKLTSNEIRLKWFQFWESKGHHIVESAPLIPDNDPTLLWINAGVTPLKKYFDGSVVPTYKRMASIQKCLRTNDIENVGKTARHQTFFEMLGNFSIGDYFKKEAIPWAFEFLTEYLELPLDKLYITVYTSDQETYDLWRQLGVQEDHLIRLDTNFWEIGPGPSGPDTEIFYDRGEKYDPEHLGIELLQKEIDNDRYIEIWNNVFSQYNAQALIPREKYPELPHKNIDTGMGLERIASILQETETNFETDLFMPIIKKIEDLSKQKYHGEMAFKVIADHIRTLVFALSDGASFGNTGREYVLRRLLRRAARFGRKLGIVEPFMIELVDQVIVMMKDAYPQLETNRDSIVYKIKMEEELFLRTLERGEEKLKMIFQNQQNRKISGEDAFRLYDTYGFPFELTEEYAKEHGFTVSLTEFQTFMNEQVEKARQSRGNQTSMHRQNALLLSFHTPSVFVGYDRLQLEAHIVALFDGEKFVDHVLDQDIYLVLDQTPFYAESGGQVSDQGMIENKEVKDVFKGPNGQHFHLVHGSFEINQIVQVSVNQKTRSATEKNHSAVHVLQKVLKEVLSSDIYQMGSYVDAKSFHFDFHYEYKISNKQITEIENRVNEKIKQDIPTNFEILSLEEAKKKGATALFMDKYGDQVRVVTIGDSMELCGGCHVSNIHDIKRFALRSIESKGNSVYRVSGTTDENIEEYLNSSVWPYRQDMMKLLDKAKDWLKKADQENLNVSVAMELFEQEEMEPHCYQDVLQVLDQCNELKGIVQDLEKQYWNLKKQKNLQDLSFYENQIVEKKDHRQLIIQTEDQAIPVLKEIIDVLENKYCPIIIFIANIHENGVNYLMKVSASLSIHAGQKIKEISLLSNGNGGGNATFAQGGGKDITKLASILEDVKKL